MHDDTMNEKKNVLAILSLIPDFIKTMKTRNAYKVETNENVENIRVKHISHIDNDKCKFCCLNECLK